jgi:hypothetical protein
MKSWELTVNFIEAQSMSPINVVVIPETRDEASAREQIAAAALVTWRLAGFIVEVDTFRIKVLLLAIGIIDDCAVL